MLIAESLNHLIAECVPAAKAENPLLHPAFSIQQFPESLLEFHHRDPPTALIVRSWSEVGDVGVCSQKLADRATELPGAVPVNDSHRFQLTEHRSVEKFLDARDGFVSVRTDDVQLGERTFARLQVHVDANSCRLRADGWRRRDDTKFVD